MSQIDNIVDDLDPEMHVQYGVIIFTKLKHTKTILEFLRTMPETNVNYRRTSIGRLRIVEVDKSAGLDLLGERSE